MKDDGSSSSYTSNGSTNNSDKYLYLQNKIQWWQASFNSWNLLFP